jgi:hypothetical protein
MFATVPVGALTDTNVNSIGCRQNYANMGQTAGSEYYCRFAALSGGGVCGNIVQNTCEIIVNTTCKGNVNIPTGWADNVTQCVVDLTPGAAMIGANQGASSGSENSIECRLYHSEVAFLGAPASHCGHPAANSAPCAGPVLASIDQYCGLIETTCTGAAYQQYFAGTTFSGKTHYASCSNSIKAFPTGNLTAGVVASSNNDYISRLYHVSANVVTLPQGWNTAHCAHAGPSGGGLLGGAGGSRASWLYISNNTVCKDQANGYIYLQIAEAMQDWPVQLAQVVPISPNLAAYSVGMPDVVMLNNTDACRIYHLSTAASNASSHCVHGSIIGGGQCGADPTWAVCKAVSLACPNAYANIGLCQAAFAPYFDPQTPQKIGNPAAAMGGAPTDDSLTCRVFYATTALMTYVGKNQTAPANICMNAAIAGAVGCNVSAIMTPKSGAASVSLFGGLAFLMLLW